jgi:hypothetical protein
LHEITLIVSDGEGNLLEITLIISDGGREEDFR